MTTLKTDEGAKLELVQSSVVELDAKEPELPKEADIMLEKGPMDAPEDSPQQALEQTTEESKDEPKEEAKEEPKEEAKEDTAEGALEQPAESLAALAPKADEGPQSEEKITSLSATESQLLFLNDLQQMVNGKK